MDDVARRGWPVLTKTNIYQILETGEAGDILEAGGGHLGLKLEPLDSGDLREERRRGFEKIWSGPTDPHV